MAGELSPQDIIRITREKYKKAVAQSQPLMCWFSVTEECDLHCKFCFADSRKPLPDELSTTEVLQMLNNITEAGTQNISLGGGEPTLRKDLLDIVYYAAICKKMLVALNTHGQHLERSYVRALARAGLRQVKVSTDGLKDSHEWNRGPGTFEKCIQALQFCKEEDIPSVIFIATISQLNYEEVPQMIKLCMDMGIDIALVQLLPLGRGKSWKHLMLTREQTEQWQRYMFEQQKVYGWTRIQFENRYIIPEDQTAMHICLDPCQPCGFFDYSVGCVTGIWSYCINASGKVVIGDVLCPELEIGDLRKESLREMWHNARLLALIRDRDNLKGKCGKCEYRYLCGGCRRMAFSTTGDLMAADPQCWRKPTVAKMAATLLADESKE